jgi:hypothetical protein
VSRFVEDCRREWERLGVADPIANEMAADLEADLKEAEAEGVSAEEVLGKSLFDAPTFAASWASERGVIPPAPLEANAPLSSRERFPSWWLILILAASALLAILGAVLVVAQAGSAEAVAPRSFLSPVPLPPPGPRGFFVHMNAPDTALHTIGLILLFAGALGLILSLLSWSPWRAHNHWSPDSGAT